MDAEDSTERKKSEVLIVEDDPEIVHFLKGLLAENYSITIVSHGETALEHIASKDAVVLDYRLPDMSGLEVLRKIKKKKPDLPVIFMTAYGDEDIAVKAFRYGVKDYLRKPFRYDDLVRSLDSCLALARLDKRGPRKVLNDDVDRITCAMITTVNNPAIKFNMQRAIIYIQNNFMNKITLDKLASEACTSKHHFSREFKRSLGCSYKEFVNTVRIEKVQELLKKSRISITEAAFSVGYVDLTSFERIFKKMVGTTPKEYKSRHASCPRTEESR